MRKKKQQQQQNKTNKMATEIVQILDFFPFEVKIYTPTFKVLAFASDLGICIEVNEYYK